MATGTQLPSLLEVLLMAPQPTRDASIERLQSTGPNALRNALLEDYLSPDERSWFGRIDARRR